MKGVAIPYIVGLLIALIVLAVAVFLVYYYVIAKQPLSCTECSAEFAAWCSKCYLLNWDGTNNMNSDLAGCVNDCNLWSCLEGSTCDLCSGAETPCKKVGVPP